MSRRWVERWVTTRRSARLDRLAAARVLSHLVGDLSGWEGAEPKSRDVLMMEARLWRIYGGDKVAATMELWVAHFDAHGEWPDLMGVAPRRRRV